jgi:5'-nucleotidase
MPYELSDLLVVGISSRALFDLDEEDRIFRAHGLAKYREHQRANEDCELPPGTAFQLVRGLLDINKRADKRLVEVIVMSRNDADSGMRIMNSIEHWGLDITRAAFTNGRELWPYTPAFQCKLFLSADPSDVRRAVASDIPAALIMPPPEAVDPADDPPDEVRVAFDGDAVLFDDESERVFQEQGLEAFQQREAALADQPMNPGPFAPFLHALQRVQSEFPEGESPIRASLVTARNAPAHRRVVNTLRSWGVRLDESFFLGGVTKAAVLQALRPHIFFDDQEAHLRDAQRAVPAAHVLPPDRKQLELFETDDETVS